MADDVLSAALDRHRIPVIDRMMEVLGLLERRPNGATIRDLVDILGLPRTTVYRILNTLQQHDVVRRSAAGSYRLGPRLLSLAARARRRRPGLRPRGTRFAASGAPVRRDRRGRKALRAATARGSSCSPRARARAATRCRSPPGSGCRSTPARRARCSWRTCRPRTSTQGSRARWSASPPAPSSTRKRLKSELARIRRQGWAEDKGEYAPSICAFAAPIAGPVRQDGRGAQRPLPRRRRRRPQGADPRVGDRRRQRHLVGPAESALRRRGGLR